MKSLFIFVFLFGTSAFAQQLPIAGCALGDFVTATGPVATVAIQGRGYSPRCLKVAKGTKVLIQASSHHPLQGILNSVGADNPIYDDLGGAVTDSNFQFNETGVFGFYCLAHSDDQGNGMGGAILVEP